MIHTEESTADINLKDTNLEWFEYPLEKPSLLRSLKK
jgi:hypothetical protein